MYGTTVDDLIRLVIQRLHDVPGIGTQTYGEDLYGEKIVECVKYVLDRYALPWYKTYTTVTIDGVNGYATEDISNIVSAGDLIHVYRQGTEEAVLYPPTNANPLRATGTRTKWIQPIPYVTATGKCFHTWPKTATDQLDLIAITRPLTLQGDSIVYMPENLVADFVAGKIVEADGSNPGWAGNLVTTFEENMIRMFKSYQRNTADVREADSGWPTEYFVEA